MDLTFNDYIRNPMGKNNAVMTASMREMMRTRYKHKFDNILLRENGKIEFYLYENSSDNTYWIYVKIPSEVVKKFYYDTVIKFSTNQKKLNAGRNLFDYNVQFFSNDPAFVYTYANVFLQKDLFINELKSKMSEKAIKDLPKEKNPDNNIGYVKSIYFVYLLMQNRNFNNLTIFNRFSEKLDIELLLNNIEDADIKIQERQEEGKKVSKKKKLVVDKDTYKTLKSMGVTSDRLVTTTTKKVKKIKNVNTSKKIKKI